MVKALINPLTTAHSRVCDLDICITSTPIAMRINTICIVILHLVIHGWLVWLLAEKELNVALISTIG